MGSPVRLPPQCPTHTCPCLPAIWTCSGWLRPAYQGANHTKLSLCPWQSRVIEDTGPFVKYLVTLTTDFHTDNFESALIAIDSHSSTFGNILALFSRSFLDLVKVDRLVLFCVTPAEAYFLSLICHVTISLSFTRRDSLKRVMSANGSLRVL